MTVTQIKQAVRTDLHAIPDARVNLLGDWGTSEVQTILISEDGPLLERTAAQIEREMQKYLKYERWVHPLRFLHCLPLSHVFGQFMGLWVPPLLAAEVHFESQLEPARLMAATNRYCPTESP